MRRPRTPGHVPTPAPPPPQPVRVVARLKKSLRPGGSKGRAGARAVHAERLPGRDGELIDGFRRQQFACRGRQLLQGHLRQRGTAQRALPRQDERLAVRTQQVRQHPKHPPPFPPLMESATAGART
jgi:hypothetical protein